MEKGSTLMEENIEGLGGEDILILHEDHRPTSLIDTWEFCKDYKESAISRQVSLSLQNAQH